MAASNGVRTALAGDDTSFGTFVMEFATPGVGALAASAGCDFVFFDLQHTGWSLKDITPPLWSCRSAGIPAGVRVPGAVPWLIGAALDLGADLIMVPAVSDEKTARAIVSAVRYPPDGERAVTFNFASDQYRPPANAGGELSRRNADAVVFAQIETTEGLENLDAIAAVDGIDVLWVGDNDLAASLGVPGQFDSPQYTEALKRVALAARTAGKAAGFTTSSVGVGTDMLRLGYRVLAYGNDIKVLQAALAEGLSSFRASAGSSNTTH